MPVRLGEQIFPWSGLLVESGHSHTYVVPIYNGKIVS